MKAQVSMEFLYFVIILIAILAVASFSALSSQRDTTSEIEIQSARRVAATVAQEINTAFEIGTGYSHKFDLPAALSSSANYSVEFPESRFVYIYWSDKSYALPVIADNVTGLVKKGRNTIKNIDGVIYID